MNSFICPKNLDISLIDFADYSYSLSPEKEISPDAQLTDSISRYGILHPPLVKKNPADHYLIVSGRKRLLAFRALHPGEKSCCCMVIPEQVSEIDVLALLLEEISIRRHVTTVEKAVFLSKLSALVDDTHRVKAFPPHLDLPSDPYQIKKILMLLDLEEPLLNALHHGTLNDKIAHDLASLSKEDRMSVFHIILSLSLSVGYQKKLLNICRELASRENTTISAILNDKSVEEIIGHKVANPPQKTKKLMHWLTSKYLPRSSQAEDEFQRFVTSMQLPPNVSVSHTPFFEDEAVTFSITFAKKESLHNTWQRIKDAISDPDN